MRKAVYTFIFGNYDTLKTPTVMTDGWDYICFTDDNNLRSNIWEVRQSIRDQEDLGLENKRFASKHKILFDNYVGDYDLSLSVDGHLQINCDLDELINENLKPESDMMICPHPTRDCIYDEAEVCKAIEKDNPRLIDEHMQRYRDAGYPTHNGLYSAKVIGRRHDRKSLKEMCKVWFEELQRGSRRDQLSLNYAIWKSAPLQIAEVDWRQQYFRRRKFLICDHFGRPGNLNPFHDRTCFDNGVAIPQIAIQLYLSVEGCFARWPNPELTTGPDSFFAWVNAPASDDPLKESATRIATLAQIAIASGNFDAFRRCIRENAFDLNAGYSPHRWTLLHQLAGLGKKTLPVHARMAEDLLSAGADVNCKTVLGWTPLHLIAMQGQAQAVELAKVLIAHRPDLMAVDDQGLGWKDNWQHGKEIYDLLGDASKRHKLAI